MDSEPLHRTLFCMVGSHVVNMNAAGKINWVESRTEASEPLALSLPFLLLLRV